jgi:hypothetical protein
MWAKERAHLLVEWKIWIAVQARSPPPPLQGLGFGSSLIQDGCGGRVEILVFFDAGFSLEPEGLVDIGIFCDTALSMTLCTLHSFRGLFSQYLIVLRKHMEWGPLFSKAMSRFCPGAVQFQTSAFPVATQSRLVAATGSASKASSATKPKPPWNTYDGLTYVYPSPRC